MLYQQFVAARADVGIALPYALATIYEAGTSTKASLYNKTGDPILNPLTAGITGTVGFAVADGSYDISISSADGEYTLPLIESYQVFDAKAALLSLLSGTMSFTLPDEASGGVVPTPGSGLPYLSGGVLKIA